MKLHCWWFGCEPYPEDPAPIEYLECRHCGDICDYESLCGLTRYIRTKDFFKFWLFRKWFPEKCIDCGKRYGHHDSCIPF